MDNKRSFFRTVEAHIGEKVIPEIEGETKFEDKIKKMAEIIGYHKTSLSEMNTAVI